MADPQISKDHGKRERKREREGERELAGGGGDHNQ